MSFGWVFGCWFSVNRRIYGYYFLVITYSEIINMMLVSPQVPDWQVIKYLSSEKRGDGFEFSNHFMSTNI